MTETTCDIFGLDLPAEQCDLLMIQHVRPKWRAFETDLMTSKWWDYRFMNPVAATYLYAYHYRQQFKHAFTRYFDRGRSAHVKAFKHYDLFKCEAIKISGCWRGRQHADAMGIPYDLYIRWAIDARMKYWHRAHLPQPQHLYSEVVTDQLGRQWEDYLLGVLMVGKHEAYRIENYAGLPAQDAHHEWLLDMAGKRANIRYALNELVEMKLLPLDKIAKRYGQEVASRFLEAA